MTALPPRPRRRFARPTTHARRRSSTSGAIRLRRGTGGPAAPGGRRSGPAAPHHPRRDEAAADRGLVEDWVAGGPGGHGERSLAVGRHRRPATAADPGRRLPYSNRGSTRQRIGTRPDRPSTRRASSRAGASPEPGSSIASVTRTVALFGHESGLQHVGIRQVAALGREWSSGARLKAAPLLGIENRRRTRSASRDPAGTASRAIRRWRRVPPCARRRSPRTREAARSRRRAWSGESSDMAFTTVLVHGGHSRAWRSAHQLAHLDSPRDCGL